MLPYDIDNLTWNDFCFYWLRNIIIRKDGAWARASMSNIRVYSDQEGGYLDFRHSHTLGEIERRGGKLRFGRGADVSVLPSELFDSHDIITYTPPLGYILNAETGGLLYLECSASRSRNRGLDSTRIRQRQPMTPDFFMGLCPATFAEAEASDHEQVLDSIVLALNQGHPTGLPDDAPNPQALRLEASARLWGVVKGEMDWLVWTPSLALVHAQGDGAIVYLRGAPWATIVPDHERLVLKVPKGRPGNSVFIDQYFKHIDNLVVEEVDSNDSN